MTFSPSCRSDGDIDGVDEDPLLVGGPPGREQGVGGAHAVDPGVDESERAEPQTRGCGRGVERELAAQQRHRTVDLARDADHVRLEIGAVDARLDGERLAPLGPSGGRRDPDGVAAPLARRAGRRRCLDADRIARFDRLRRRQLRALRRRSRAGSPAVARRDRRSRPATSAGCRLPGRRAVRRGYWDCDRDNPGRRVCGRGRRKCRHG